VTPAVESLLTRRVRRPSAAEHALLLLAGWSTTERRGEYERDERRVWWLVAREGR
jgi:hypothetical protein